MAGALFPEFSVATSKLRMFSGVVSYPAARHYLRFRGSQGKKAFVLATYAA